MCLLVTGFQECETNSLKRVFASGCASWREGILVMLNRSDMVSSS